MTLMTNRIQAYTDKLINCIVRLSQDEEFSHPKTAKVHWPSKRLPVVDLGGAFIPHTYFFFLFQNYPS